MHVNGLLHLNFPSFGGFSDGHKALVDTVLYQQFFMGSVFDDGTAINDQNLICILNGSEPVGDGNDGLAMC